MKPSSSSEYNEKDREIIQLLQDLGSLRVTYPADLLRARRAAFLADVDRLSPVASGDEFSAAEQEFVNLFGNLKSTQADYPPHLLSARRAALLRQIESLESPSIWDQVRVALQRIFQTNARIPALPTSGLLRYSLGLASLIAILVLGSLFFLRTEQAFQAAPSPIRSSPSSTVEAVLTICDPANQTSPCPSGELDPGQDLADARNGAALPAVSKDARSSTDGIHTAVYVNDGHVGASWVSNSPDSWIKIDLGQIRTINTISLQRGKLDSSGRNNPGHFVIAVAQSDVYAGGDSTNDDEEYIPVFHSAQTDYSGAVSQSDTIQTQFPAARARFVKITFEEAGTAIEEVSVFMIEPPELAGQAAVTPRDELPGITLTPPETNTLSAIDTAEVLATGTGVPSDTATPSQTLASSSTPIPLPTLTPSLENPSTPVPTDPPPTPVPPTIEPTATSIDPIVVTGSTQTLTFTCNGNDVEIRGQGNTVTLLGSCGSITVTGNSNLVFWQFGAPIITNRGRDNIISQL
jgi:hypothetical protein